MELAFPNADFPLVSPPYYWKGFDDVNSKQMNYLSSYVEEFTRRHNVNYINLQSDTSFVEEDFADAVHLSSKGAEKFTKKLWEIINNENH